MDFKHAIPTFKKDPDFYTCDPDFQLNHCEYQRQDAVFQNWYPDFKTPKDFNFSNTYTGFLTLKTQGRDVQTKFSDSPHWIQTYQSATLCQHRSICSVIWGSQLIFWPKSGVVQTSYPPGRGVNLFLILGCPRPFLAKLTSG